MIRPAREVPFIVAIINQQRKTWSDRAAKENIPQMSVIILPQEEHLKYLFESTMELITV